MVVVSGWGDGVVIVGGGDVGTLWRQRWLRLVVVGGYRGGNWGF